MRNRLFLPPWFVALRDCYGAGILRSTVLCTVVLVSLSQRSSRAESTPNSVSRPVTSSVSKPDTSELFYETYLADDVFKFSGGEITSMIYYGGIEYDKRSLGNDANRFGRIWSWPATLVHARVSYVMEFLPLVLIRQPTLTDVWGDALVPTRKTVPGIAVSPVGFRWMWFDGRAVRPLWVVKVGEAVFTQKALGNNASYENFTINSVVGLQTRLTSRYDLRLAYGYQHVSNAYSNKSNPGLDTLGPSFGLVYHMKSYCRR